MFGVKPKRWIMASFTTILLSVVLVFSLVSCAGEAERESEEITLEIWSFFPQAYGLNRFAALYYLENPHVTLNLRCFGNDRVRFIEQLRMAFMTGDLPDLFMLGWLDYKDPSIAGMLADWLPIMRAHPEFDENDYFMNVLEATMVEDRLVAFPANFSFGTVAANTAVPGLVEAMANIDGISTTDMMDLVLEFDPSKYVHQHFYLHSTALVSFFAGGDIQKFIDFEEQRVDLNNQNFIDYITRARDMAIPIPDVGRRSPVDIEAIGSDREARYSRTNLFMHVSPNRPQYFLSLDNLYFEGITPIVNYHGELIIHNWMSYGLSASTTQAQREAAWELIRFTQRPENNVIGTANMVPTYRPLFRHDVERNASYIGRAMHWNGWRFAESQRQSIDDATALLENILEMPMVDHLTLPDTASAIIWEATDLFKDGLITSEQLAVDLQNQLTLILMERDW